MASKTDIANMALLKLGQPAIMSMEDNSHQARLCAQEFGAALEAILRAYPWPFAIRRKELNRMIDKPPFGPRYYYQIPADSVRVIEWHTESFPYQVEGDKVLCNAERVAIRYVSRDIEIAKLDIQTVDVVATELAIRLCIIIKEDMELLSQLMAQQVKQMADARHSWAQEDHPQEVIEGDWLVARVSESTLIGGRALRTYEVFNPWGPDGKGVTSIEYGAN